MANREPPLARYASSAALSPGRNVVRGLATITALQSCGTPGKVARTIVALGLERAPQPADAVSLHLYILRGGVAVAVVGHAFHVRMEFEVVHRQFVVAF